MRFPIENYVMPKNKILWPETPPTDYIAIAKHIVYAIICVVALLSVFFFVAMQDATASMDKAEKIAVAMMNGDALHDVEEGNAYFTTKVTVVKLNKENKQ